MAHIQRQVAPHVQDIRVLIFRRCGSSSEEMWWLIFRRCGGSYSGNVVAHIQEMWWLIFRRCGGS